MALVGGFFASYAIILRADFMGNAQTTNWIFMIFALLGANFIEFIIRLGGVFLYIFSAILYEVLSRKSEANMQILSISIDAAAIIILGFLPYEMDPILALYPIFFAMSFQWNAFSGAYGYVSSPIFSTNNTRQIGLAIGDYICDHDRKHLHRLVFFLGSIGSFHIGVILCYFAVKYLGINAIWINILFLISGLILVRKEKKTSDAKASTK